MGLPYHYPHLSKTILEPDKANLHAFARLFTVLTDQCRRGSDVCTAPRENVKIAVDLTPSRRAPEAISAYTDLHVRSVYGADNRLAVSALPRAAHCTYIRGLATSGFSTPIPFFHRFEQSVNARCGE